MLNISFKHQPLGHSSRLLGIILMLFVMASCSKPEQSPMTTLPLNNTISLIAGTYSDTDSRGVYQLTYDPATHSFTDETLLAELSNPSYGTASKNRDKYYFVVEDSDGKVQAFNSDRANAGLVPINGQSTQGMHPCYLALSPDEQHLAVANYSSGNVAVFGLDGSGAVQGEPRVLQHQGVGVNPERQEGPHAHWAEWSPESTFLYVVDLGLDQVMAYPFDQDTGELGDGFTALKTTPGAGPRHMVFHPTQDRIYLFNELSNEVVMANRAADGTLAPAQTISSLPEGFEGATQGAHIAINDQGTRLYVSNPGHDSIAVFGIAGDGTMQLLQHIATGGHWPRFFLLLDEEGLLLVANQRSDNIVAFKIDAQGTLSRVGEPAVISQPTYLAAVKNQP